MSDLGNRNVMAKNIQYYMKKNRHTRRDVCKALNFPYSTFTEWVKGTAYPRIDKIEQMALFWGVKKSDLIESHDRIKSVESIVKEPIYSQEMIDLWKTEIGEIRLSEDEVHELINYAKYIVGKRGH